MSDGTPLVSVLIPTHNRPHFLRMALKSVLDQTYSNIEIIILDTSTDEQTEALLRQYVNKFPHIKYFKQPEHSVTDKFTRCFQLAQGEYINYLMDDDLFHPEKIMKMIHFYLQDKDITLVTSHRTKIDQFNNLLPDGGANIRLFPETTIIDGKELGNIVLTSILNVIGEPTTVLFRRKDFPGNFGFYKGRQYYPVSDVASWLTLLSKGKAVYIPESLSYQRLHPEQLSQTIDVGFYYREWLDFIIDSRSDGFLNTKELFQSALNRYRETLMPLYPIERPEMEQRYMEDFVRIQSILQTL